MPGTSTFAQFVQLLEDGDFHGELSEALRDLSQAMSDHAKSFGSHPKAKLTVAIGFHLTNGVFEISADFATKIPKPPRGRTIAWSTPDYCFTPQNPRQMGLFGVRDVTPPGPDEIRQA